MKLDMKTPNSPQPAFFANNQSLSNRNNPISNSNMTNGGYNNGMNGNRTGIVIKSVESKIKG